MEFKFNVNGCLKDEITIVDRNNSLLKCCFQRSPSKDSAHSEELREIIDTLGTKSATAQGLNCPITSTEQLLATDQRLYILKQNTKNSTNGKVVGMLKVGKKKLFFLCDTQQVEVIPLCVLDFYVSETCQRQGNGLKLFNYMLQIEKVKPEHIAVDRPSTKMLAFYKKQYHLSAPMKQPNNFVVFRDFFKGFTAVSSKRWTDHQKRGPIFLKAVTSNNSSNNNKETPPQQPQQLNQDQEPVLVTETPNRHQIQSSQELRTTKEPKLPSLLEQPLSRLGITMTPPLTKTKISAPYRTPYSNNKNTAGARNTSFWSRNDLISSNTTNYVVGASDQSISAQSRYLNYGKPRPF